MEIKTRRLRGQSLVEFALCFPIFFLMVSGLIDFSRYYFYESSMSHTVRAALRVAVTGKVDENPYYDPSDPNSNQYLTRRETIINAARSNNPGRVPIRAGASAPLSQDTLFITPADGGDPGEEVTVSLQFEIAFITPLIQNLANMTAGEKFKITISQTYLNEEFDNE